MQSSARNCWNVRLKTATHSRAESFCGPDGGLPVSGRVRSATVDKLEAAHAGLRLAFAAPAGAQAHRGADAAGEHETGAERAGGDERELRPELPRHVGRLAEPFAQRLDRTREPLALGLDVAPDLLRSSSVRAHSERSSLSW